MNDEEIKKKEAVRKHEENRNSITNSTNQPTVELPPTHYRKLTEDEDRNDPQPNSEKYNAIDIESLN